MRITKETKTVAELVLIHIRNRSFGILGEPTVHVLHLDIALDAMRLLCYDKIRCL
jgi:K+-transporting ATPase c subunit